MLYDRTSVSTLVLIISTRHEYMVEGGRDSIMVGDNNDNVALVSGYYNIVTVMA